MTTTVRAALGVLLLAGVYVLGAAVFVAFLLAAVLAFRVGGGAIKLGLLALIAAFAVGRTLVVVGRSKAPDPEGFPVTRTSDPELWATVDELAAAVGTRSADRILLVPEVNAGVLEQTRFLGLVPGRRILLLGVPLLMTLSRDQLRAVLCHEFGHYSHAHTRLAALTHGGYKALGRIIVGLQDRPAIRWIFLQYAKMFFAVSGATSRRQELEADAAAARIVRKSAMSGALREVQAQAVAWSFYLREYVAYGLAAGRRPAHVFAGYSSLLQDPERARQLDEVREEPADDQRSPYDTHPPLSQRLAAIERLPDVETPADDRPAWTVLQDPDAAFRAVQELLIPGDEPGSSWQEVIATAADAHTKEAVRPLITAAAKRFDGPVTPDRILAMYEQGRAGELVSSLVPDPEQRVAVAQALLTDFAALLLVEAGRAHWRLSWTIVAELVDDEGNVVELLTSDAAAEPARAQEVRQWLIGRGVDLTRELTPPEAAPDGAQLFGILPEVRWDREVCDVLITDAGLLRVPIRGRYWANLRQQFGGNPRRKRISELLAKNWAEMLALPGAVLVPADAITKAQLSRKLGIWKATLDMTDGSTVVIKCSVELVPLDEGIEMFRACVGDRVREGGRRRA